jgi:exodeoxyribonuclease V alpha subunit
MNAELRRLRAQDRLGSVDVHLAETLARRGRESRSDVALAAALASRAVSDGHVCLDLARACGEAGGPGPALESWHASLQASAIVDDGTDGAPLVHEAGRLYLRRYWEAEQLLARALRARALAPDLSHDPALLERDLQRVFGADARSARQRAAARVAARRPLCVISGGPGTGKTAIVVRVLALLVAQATAAGLAAPRIALLAPTGKAARRLEQAVATGGTALDPDLMRGVPRQAMTLHRALGARPGGGFRHARQRPLTADVVVVDEASMVDLPLMAQLVDAVRGDARLILLGDRDQLASVEAGAVLSDICGPSEHDGSGDGLAASIVTLKEVFRYASGGRIARLSEAINAGDADAALALLEDASDASVTRIEPGAAALTERAVHGYLPYLRAAQDADAVAAFRRFRVLCAHQQGPKRSGSGAVQRRRGADPRGCQRQAARGHRRGR